MVHSTTLVLFLQPVEYVATVVSAPGRLPTRSSAVPGVAVSEQPSNFRQSAIVVATDGYLLPTMSAPLKSMRSSAVPCTSSTETGRFGLHLAVSSHIAPASDTIAAIWSAW